MKRKRVIRKRAKRASNGTTQWVLTMMNTRTGAQRAMKVLATYDEITAKVHRVRARSRYTAVCAEEMERRSRKVLENGRVVALDSLEDEAMFAAPFNPESNGDTNADNWDAWVDANK